MLVTIQSANRPYQVPVMNAALGDLEAVWYVPADQAKEYEAEGAKVRAVNGQLPMKTKQLNAALEDGFANNEIVVTMDDDFLEAKLLVSENPIKSEPRSLSEMVNAMARSLVDSQYFLAGIAGTTNAFWAKKSDITWGMVTGQILVHKNNSIRFDENLEMLEDLDYVIAHHLLHKGLQKNRAFLPNFHIFGRSAKSDATYSGGYQHHRTEEAQARTLAYLQSKYADLDLVFENNGLGKSVQRLVNFRKLVK